MGRARDGIEVIADRDTALDHGVADEAVTGAIAMLDPGDRVTEVLDLCRRIVPRHLGPGGESQRQHQGPLNGAPTKGRHAKAGKQAKSRHHHDQVAVKKQVEVEGRPGEGKAQPDGHHEPTAEGDDRPEGVRRKPADPRPPT